MESESEWWRYLLKRPKDKTAWLVYADWLQDRDDDRAEGVRAIAILRLRPWNAGKNGKTKSWGRSDAGKPYGCSLTYRWYMRLATHTGWEKTWQAYSDAARAFGKLPDDERRRLLAGAGMV